MELIKNVLVVDDEKMIRDAVASYLEKKGFRVYTASGGAEALRIFLRERIAFVILDLMLPDLTGEELCARLRRQSNVPILMLTAKSMEEDLLNGLRLGADDYMTKPFSLKELYARMEAILRRCAEDLKPLSERLCFDDGALEVDFEGRQAFVDGRNVSLTPIEWKLLTAFVRYPGRLFSRDELLTHALGDDFDGYDRVIDTHIKNLRKKIEREPKRPHYIRTVHGLGYQFGGTKA